MESKKRELIGEMEGEGGQAKKKGKWCEMKGTNGREEEL